MANMFYPIPLLLSTDDHHLHVHPTRAAVAGRLRVSYLGKRTRLVYRSWAYGLHPDLVLLRVLQDGRMAGRLRSLSVLAILGLCLLSCFLEAIAVINVYCNYIVTSIIVAVGR